MSLPIVFFVISGALLVAGVVLREFQVDGDGTLSRSWPARVIGLALTIAVIIAAAETLQRLREMAL